MLILRGSRENKIKEERGRTQESYDMWGIDRYEFHRQVTERKN